eukprot:Amastigsp_a528884_3.p4 type:complete len:120 gc:universal Amastigsp_a528884_3:86-445(+)
MLCSPVAGVCLCARGARCSCDATLRVRGLGPAAHAAARALSSSSTTCAASTPGILILDEVVGLAMFASRAGGMGFGAAVATCRATTSCATVAYAKRNHCLTDSFVRRCDWTGSSWPGSK